ncbi:docking protein 2 [Hippoglossus stenolepis]|uniref:docking protein 2 n=1 Tax=Hippoglossus stenolepis TaxID=195615 RepID=UPI001FB0341A|nr:docking protein 2 [Hippoglossus stenolepis]
MDVIFKEGLLYLQGVKFGKRTWRKIWMVLYKPSSTGVGRLELFTVWDKNNVADQKRASRQKTPERKVVRLCDCLSVTPAPDKSCPQGCTAFYLKTTQCTYTLASTTSQDWLSAVCLLAFQKDPEESDKRGLEGGNGPTMENNDLYSSWKTNPTLPPNHYRVTVQSTEASWRCRLAGEYLLSTEEEGVTLLAYNTGHVIYHWPYTLLRRFGQVEGGFSFDASHRCQSGNGLFIFLSPHGPEIFQIILERCSVERSSSAQAFNISRRWSCDQSPSTYTFPPAAAGPPVYNPADVPVDAEDDSTVHYSTINYNGLNLVKLSKSQEAVGDVGEDELCYSLGSVSLDGDTEDNIYYNWRRSTPPLIRGDPETDEEECIYSDVKNDDSPSNSRLQPFSSPLCQPVLQPPPCPLPLPVLSALNLKPRYQHQPTVSNVNQAGFNTQAHEVDGMNEMEEAISSSAHAIAPSETPGSFKYKLAELFSKDLAKIQPPLPSGVGGPTFSH